MNIQEKRSCLQKLLEHNIKNEEIGTAIAIIGSWGIGKTFFWNELLKSIRENDVDNVLSKRKYAYISLFGVESLSDLKTQIYSNVENHHLPIEIPKWLKSLPSIFKDTRVTQLGINAPIKLIDNLMFNQVKEAVICFDDFERMSNKLDIKDVMGLANQLKLEKNCQVILILDETKTEDKNKEKYAEYKEKLIDETIKITSVESLIREKAKDIDDSLVDLMVKFADELEIHNFRFFQKVIKLYKEFRSKLPEMVADSTKEIILIRILQGYLITDFPKLEYEWSDCEYHTENERADWTEIKSKTYNNLQKVSYLFVYSDNWLAEFKKWFEQTEGLDYSQLIELVKLDLISEESNQLREKLKQLMEQWRNLEIDDLFCLNLFETARKSIAQENLENLRFYCTLLKEFGRSDLSRQLKRDIKEKLRLSLMENVKATVDNAFGFGYKKDNVFHNYIKYWERQNPSVGLPILSEVMARYLLLNGWNNSEKIILQQASKQDWESLIWEQIPNDSRYTDSNKMRIIRQILEQQIDIDLQPQINAIIFEILEEKVIEANGAHKKNIEYVIKRLTE